MKSQVSVTTHLATGMDQKVSGHNQPLPSPDRVKPHFWSMLFPKNGIKRKIWLLFMWSFNFRAAEMFSQTWSKFGYNWNLFSTFIQTTMRNSHPVHVQTSKCKGWIMKCKRPLTFKNEKYTAGKIFTPRYEIFQTDWFRWVLMDSHYKEGVTEFFLWNPLVIFEKFWSKKYWKLCSISVCFLKYGKIGINEVKRALFQQKSENLPIWGLKYHIREIHHQFVHYFTFHHGNWKIKCMYM